MTRLLATLGAWTRAHRGLLIEVLLVLAAFTGLAVLITWPLATDIGGLIPGLPGGDQLGYLFDFWYFATYSLPLLADQVQDVVGAPFGRLVPAVPNLTLAATLVPATLLTKVFGAVVAYNVVTIAGLALTGAAMYLLVRWLGLGVGPAAWAGLAYTVIPYHLLAAQSWVTLVAYQCFPLLLMALIAWVRRPTWRNGIGTVAATLFAVVSFPYFGVMGLIMVAVAMVVSYILQGRHQGWAPALRAPALLAGGLVVFLFLPLGIISALNRSGTVLQTRSLDEVSTLGPYLSDYWTPPKTSAFMNGFTDPNTWYGLGSVGGERLMYIGAGAIILFVVGIVAAIAWRRSLTPTWMALAIAGPAMMVVLLVVSLRTPYPIAGVEVPTPARLIFEVVPYVRAFGRFIIAIAAIAIVIGALGLRLVMNRFGPVGRKVLVSSALVLTAFEAAVGLPILVSPAGQLPHGNTVSTMPTWNWLAQQQDDGIVFEQPGVGNTSLDRIWMYGASVHGHRVLNVVANPGDQSGDLIGQVNGPPNQTAARVMATAGIRWVTIHPWAYRDLGTTAPTAPSKGFEEAVRFPDGSRVWRVTAPPADGFVTFASGFDMPRFERRGGDWLNWRWMFSRAEVRAWVDEPGTYRAEFRAAPAGGRQRLIATSPDGSRSSATVAREGTVLLTIQVRARGDVIRLRTEPGATAPGQPTLQLTPWLLTRIP